MKALPMTIPTGWRDFLATAPPNKLVDIIDLVRFPENSNGSYGQILTPDIVRPCENDKCGGERIYTAFNTATQPLKLKEIEGNKEYRYHRKYVCRNCDVSTIYIYVHLNFESTLTEDDKIVHWLFKAQKIGEHPTFALPTPSKLIALIGPDRDLYLKGRACEVQGLGLGSAAYYRRVVENQKNRLLEKIRIVAKKIGAPSHNIEQLDKAIQEHQFTRAVDIVKDAIPPELLIDGHNPLKLLHNSLSENLHADTDAECLELAESIRTVLLELARRLDDALRDEDELKLSVNRLLSKKKK